MPKMPCVLPAGEEVTATKGAKAKLSRPLDFLVIADHSDAMGATKAIMEAPRIALLTNKFLLRWHDMMNESDEGSLQVTAELIDGAAKGTLPESLTDPEETRERTADLWKKHGEIINRYNEPGKFTAFMGFEYTPMPQGDNLHRVVMFRDDPEEMGDTIPYGALGSQDPEKLWTYMDAYEKKTGGQVLAIPHNSNVSNGRMFAMNKFDGSPIDAAYIRTRALREPIVEVTQIKGDSESHPFLSPNDEFCQFRRHRMGQMQSELHQRHATGKLWWQLCPRSAQTRAGTDPVRRRQSFQIRHDRIDRQPHLAWQRQTRIISSASTARTKRITSNALWSHRISAPAKDGSAGIICPAAMPPSGRPATRAKPFSMR